MGRRARRVLGVVAAIAVPFAAPVVAAKIGLSAAIGSVAGSAVAGAALGAGAAAIGGTDIGRGALLGGIGGGVSAYLNPAATAAGGAGAGGATAAQPGFSLSDVMAGGTGTATAAPATFTPAATAAPGLNLQSVMAGGAAYAPAAAPLFSTAADAAAAPSFMQAIRGVPGAIAERMSDPKNLADLTLRAGASLLTGELAGDGLSDQERQLLEQQITELQELRGTNEELFKTRLQEAMNLLGEARYFNPEAFGLRAMADVQLAGAQATREAERQAALRPGQAGLSAADRRRAGLDITARGQAAYARGAESAQQQRMTTLQASLAQLPDRGPTSALNYGAGLSQQFALADERRRQDIADINSVFGTITGARRAASIG